MCLVESSDWQAVKFQMWWVREQEDAGSRAVLGWLLGFQRTHLDSVCLSLVCLLPNPCVLLPVPNDLILLSLCNREFALQWWCSAHWPSPSIKLETWGKAALFSRGMRDVRCLPPAHVLCEAVMALHPPPLRWVPHLAMVVHSTFLFPLIIEGTSR